jgi:hypothetical protein
MRLSVKILGTKSRVRYSVSRLVTMAETVLKAEFPDLEVEIQELKTQEEIFKYTQVLIAPGLVIDEKLVYDLWIPSTEQVLNWMREAIAQKQSG